MLTWFFACGALESQQIAFKVNANGEKEDISYPLAEVLYRIPAGEWPVLRWGFGVIALFGLIASYHAMLYAASRQAFALGRAGYLPLGLGHVHAARRTPAIALAASSLLSAGFVVANVWFKDAISVAVLVSTLTALVWYVLAMICLVVLRRREPSLFQDYRAPVSRVLPWFVAVLSVFGIVAYASLRDAPVVFPLAAGLYALGIGYYWTCARGRLRSTAPEEQTARQTQRAPS